MTTSIISPVSTNYTLKAQPYDIHTYFTAKTRSEAMIFRQLLSQQFPWLRVFEPHDNPIGPHSLPQHEMDFGCLENAQHHSAVVKWIADNHGSLSVLIHPNTLDGNLKDHTVNAVWVGEPVPLNDAFVRAQWM